MIEYVLVVRTIRPPLPTLLYIPFMTQKYLFLLNPHDLASQFLNSMHAIHLRFLVCRLLVISQHHFIRADVSSPLLPLSPFCISLSAFSLVLFCRVSRYHLCLRFCHSESNNHLSPPFRWCALCCPDLLNYPLSPTHMFSIIFPSLLSSRSCPVSRVILLRCTPYIV